MLLDDNERKAMLAAIIDSSDDAIISKDLNGFITSWNKSAERMFGYTYEEVVGKHISILIPPERQTEEDMIISNIRAGRRVEHYETVRRAKNGDDVHISITVSPIRSSNGIIGASKIARDISRQKEAEELNKKYTERLELIYEIGKTIVTELDLQRIVQKVTDATTHISGAAFGAFFYNVVDAKGESYMLYGLSGASREHFEKFGMPRNTAVFSKTFSGEGVLRSDDITKDERYGKNKPHSGIPAGHLPVVSYLAVPIISKTGIVIGGLFFGHPKPGMFKEEHETLVSAIATQAAIAMDNAKLYEEITALNKRKDEFIGFASHELKTPLTTISGYIQLALQAPELTKDFVPKMARQVERLSGIISDLMDLSKIMAGKMELNIAQASLFTIIKDSIESVNEGAGSHKIRTELPPHDENIFVDAQKIGQVLINLLNNAIKYSPGKNEVLVSATKVGDEIQISIRDWGLGIAGEHIDKIFSRFYRVTSSKNKIPGLGVGLYLSQEIMESHRGKVWVDSVEGQGSTFHISFPIERTRIYR